MKISIIIPSIGKDTLWSVLQSLEKQITHNTHVWWEILVVFDGSLLNKNNTQAQKYCTKDFLFLEQTNPQYYGRSGARNMGLQHATGDVVVFLGDDTIPVSGWGARLVDFYNTHNDMNAVLLGFVGWTPQLATDPLHQWLLSHAQFAYTDNLKPDWRHFYTSCIAMRRSLIGDERFNEEFKGWGFEDNEFGYRLHKKGMQMTYDPQWRVEHDHPQDWDVILQHMHSAGANAKVFEQLHPGVKIIPRGVKRLLLRIIVWKLRWIPWKPKKLQWWTQWKDAWLKGTQ